MSVTSAPDYSHTDAYAQGYDDGLRAARRPTTPEAAPFPASPARLDSTRIAGEHPHDTTLLFWHRRLLRTIERGGLFTAGEAPTLEELVEACLVARTEGQWVLTDDGRAYLAAHDEARTRRTERPGPPKLPEGWTVGGGDERLGYYSFEGRLVRGLGSNLGGCAFAAHEGRDHCLEGHAEGARAQLALIAYLRARLAYQSWEARDGAAPAPPAEPVDGARVGDGEGRPEEPLCTSEVSP